MALISRLCDTVPKLTTGLLQPAKHDSTPTHNAVVLWNHLGKPTLAT